MKSARTKQYQTNKASKVGDEIICPICGNHFIKKQHQQAFCCNDCKNKYWNAKKDRHKGGISNDAKGYYKQYNMQHPQRLERVGIDLDKIREEEDYYAMCENPILGI